MLVLSERAKPKKSRWKPLRVRVQDQDQAQPSLLRCWSYRNSSLHQQRRGFLIGFGNCLWPVPSGRNKDKGLLVGWFYNCAILKHNCIQHTNNLFCTISRPEYWVELEIPLFFMIRKLIKDRNGDCVMRVFNALLSQSSQNLMIVLEQ